MVVHIAYIEVWPIRLEKYLLVLLQEYMSTKCHFIGIFWGIQMSLNINITSPSMRPSPSPRGPLSSSTVKISSWSPNSLSIRHTPRACRIFIKLVPSANHVQRWVLSGINKKEFFIIFLPTLIEGHLGDIIMSSQVPTASNRTGTGISQPLDECPNWRVIQNPIIPFSELHHVCHRAIIYYNKHYFNLPWQICVTSIYTYSLLHFQTTTFV